MSKTTIKKLLQSMTKAQFDVSVGTSAASVSVFENVKRYNVKTVKGRAGPPSPPCDADCS